MLLFRSKDLEGSQRRRFDVFVVLDLCLEVAGAVVDISF